MYSFKFADIGEGINEGKVAEIFVKVGDKVKEGQNLVSVETDKITADLPSPANGTISKINITTGQQINVGHVMFEIDDGKGDAAKKSEATKPAEVPKAESKSQQHVESASVVGEVKVSNDRLPDFFKQSTKTGFANSPMATATPVARAVASSMNIDINSLKGTGPEGRVLKDDVLAASSAPKKPASSTEGKIAWQGPVEHVVAKPAIKPTPTQQDFFGNNQEKRLPISQVRHTIAKVVKGSWDHVAYTNLVNEIEVSKLVSLRNQVKDELLVQGIKLTYLAYMVKAFAKALEEFPTFNATYDEAKNEIVCKRDINIGIAVDAPQGLTVPVIKHANNLTITQISHEITRLADAARHEKLAVADIVGGTFSITNFGSFGALFGVPVIKWPELAIAGIGSIVEKPMFNAKNEIVKGYFLNLTVSTDHRWLDGADIGRFVARVTKYLQNPAMLLH